MIFHPLGWYELIYILYPVSHIELVVRRFTSEQNAGNFDHSNHT